MAFSERRKYNRTTIYGIRVTTVDHVSEPYYKESRLAISEASLLNESLLNTFDHV